MFEATFTFLAWAGVVMLMVLGIAFAIGHTKESGVRLTAFLVFVAFYFLLLGLRFMIGMNGGDGLFLGDLLASLALTFFWVMRQRQS